MGGKQDGGDASGNTALLSYCIYGLCLRPYNVMLSWHHLRNIVLFCVIVKLYCILWTVKQGRRTRVEAGGGEKG